MEKDENAPRGSDGMERKTTQVFFIPPEEMKDFYFKLAFIIDPHACTPNRTEYELLKILHRNLKKAVKLLSLVNSLKWNESMPEIQNCCGLYLMEDTISKKERMDVYTHIGKHLQALTQLGTNSRTMHQLYDIHLRLAKNVERLLQQYPEEKKYADKK